MGLPALSAADAMGAAFSALENALERVGAPVGMWMGEGLPMVAIDAQLRSVPVMVAGEVREYFARVNGLREDRAEDYELFPGAVMLTLEQATALYVQSLAAARQVAGRAGIRPSAVWDRRWFPLFQSGSGDLHVTVAGVDGGETAPVLLVTQEERTAVFAYDSLTALIATVAACYDSGAFTIDGDAVREDRARAAAIVRRYNPERVRQALAMASRR